MNTRSFIQSSLIIILLCIFIESANGQLDKKKDPAKSNYVSLTGEALAKGNGVGVDGNIHQVSFAALHLLRTKASSPKGTILLLPGGAYEVIKIKNEGSKIARFLNEQLYDVAILEYHISPQRNNRSLAFADALQAFRLLKTKQQSLGLRGNRLVIMGVSSGGHLAAKTVQRLNDQEQPDDLILTSPFYLNETIAGTVYPAVTPPIHPTPRLFASFSANDKKAWINSCQEYEKTWKGYDGMAAFTLLKDSESVSVKEGNPLDSKLQLAGLLKTFLDSKVSIDTLHINPATVALKGYAEQRHNEKLALIAKEKFNLVLIGNSITHNFEKPEFQPIWNQFFAPRKALNLGTSGYRTENLIWNIQNGELEGQSPKVVVLEIGTNNVDEKNYPTRHTAGELAGGIEAIVKLLRQKLPDTKIIVLRCFPGCYGGPNPTSHRAILERASDIVSKLADGKHIFYCDVNQVFLNMDGAINHNMMPDWLHPSFAGAKAWAQAMEPLLSQLMGDQSLDTDLPANTAIVPVTKLEEDGYNWWDRHNEVLRIKDSINPEIVLIGNSITHYWGGEPALKSVEGKLRTPNGAKSWDAVFSKYRVLNLGFGWDRTQNVLWRLDHGELDGLHPRTVVIDIGTNNTSQTNNAKMNTATEIVEGIRSVCMRVRSKLPGAKIILMAVFPREQSPTHPRRMLINDINRLLKAFATTENITLVDIGPAMLAPDGTYLPGMTSDYCHPTEKGYNVWGNAIRSLIAE